MSDAIKNREEQKRANRKKSAIITTLVHALIIVLFLFFGFTSAFPPPVEGILVNFGMMKTGSGETQPEVKQPRQEVAPVEAQAPAVPETQEAPAEVATQNVEQTISVKQQEKEEPKKQPEKKAEVKPRPVKEEKKPVKEAEEPKPVKEEPKVDTKSLYTGKEAPEDNPGNEGGLYTPGDRGDPSGELNSKNYEGTSTGLGNIGVGYDLAGRSLLDIPKIDEDYKETGKVVVSIKVDRNGKVIFAKYTVKGSTTTDPKLIRLAEEAAMQAKFNANSKAVEEQFGSITFTFKLK